VRGCVQWQQGNMLDAAFLAGAAPYDVIFCRNLLIYFDAATQGRAVAVLRRLLAPQGLLLAGHSESGVVSAHGFASAQIPMAFAFRKAEAVVVPKQAPSTPARPVKPAPRPVTPRPAFKPSQPAPVSPRRPAWTDCGPCSTAVGWMRPSAPARPISATTAPAPMRC
jgi:chemotaxis protein methyltransferase WspC